MAQASAHKASAGDASTRERMLDVALDAFAELGYDGASTRAIAGRAGVNQGLIPYYFGTKEKLWREAVDRAFAEMVAELGDVLGKDPPPPRERLEQLIRRTVRFVGRRPAFVQLMSDEGKRDGPRMRWIVDRHVKAIFDVLEEVVRETASAFQLPQDLDPLHVYYIFVGAVTQLFHQSAEFRRLSGRDPTDSAVIEAHADALVALFVGAPSPPTRRTKS
jgi:TetR/AcrR family transcriptional regulator